jgi:hypothetical protein
MCWNTFKLFFYVILLSFCPDVSYLVTNQIATEYVVGVHKKGL